MTMNKAQAELMARRLNFIGAGAGVLFFLHRRWYTLFLCLGCIAAALIITGMWLDWFTLSKTKQNQQKHRRDRRMELFWAVFVPGFALGMTVKETMLEAKPVFLLAGIGTAVFLVGLRFVRDFRGDLGKLACAGVIGFMFMMAAVCQINVLLNFNPPEVTLVQVTDLRMENHYRRADRYYCTVLTPEGEMELKISRAFCEKIGQGDLVQFQYSHGALGIPYGEIELR